MKRLFYLIIMLLVCRICKGQNLVPNGDFENYSGCPTDVSQIDSALFWMNPSAGAGSPDYYNECSSSSLVGVPYNVLGYQPARSGNGYSGIYIWVNVTGNVREYIETPLTMTLSANNCYYFEMYVNFPNACQFTSDAIGIYFSDTAVTGITNYYPLSITLHSAN